MSERIEDIYGYIHVTTKEISRGGQGVVFRTQNPNIALKIELDKGVDFSHNIENNKNFDSLRLLPIPENINLTLPKATLKEYAGYIMLLLEDMDSFEALFDFSFDKVQEYDNIWLNSLKKSAPDFVNVMGQFISSGGRRRRLEAYFKVSCILTMLHSKGLVYCDFSAKNVFMSKSLENNAVWIIDADNLNYQEETKHNGYYTPGYGAPEVIKGKGCTFYSDSYAFAVSLFWQITETHPFKGALTENDFDQDGDFADDAEQKAYAGDLPWIFDNEDKSNFTNTRIPQAKEALFSERLFSLFDRTFSKQGREKRQTRPTMYEWSYELARELDTSIKCTRCGMDYDVSLGKCPWCDNINKSIILKSTVGNKQLWTFSHELIDNKDIEVPYRLLNGFRMLENDFIAFTIRFKNNELSIANLNENYIWAVCLNKENDYVDIYGRASIPSKCIIKCTNKITSESVIIGVSIT